MKSVEIIAAKLLELGSAFDCLVESLRCQARFYFTRSTDTFNQKYARLMETGPERLILVSDYNIDLTAPGVGLINDLSSSNSEVARQVRIKKRTKGRLGSSALRAAMLERAPTPLQGYLQLRAESPEHPA
jgi:hypothetical protein